MKDHKIQFADAKIENGQVVTSNIRMIRKADIGKCPHVIFVPSHYRADGSCRCNDKTHKEMKKMGL